MEFDAFWMDYTRRRKNRDSHIERGSGYSGGLFMQSRPDMNVRAIRPSPSGAKTRALSWSFTLSITFLYGRKEKAHDIRHSLEQEYHLLTYS
jgi:hypothetical protein